MTRAGPTAGPLRRRVATHAEATGALRGEMPKREAQAKSRVPERGPLHRGSGLAATFLHRERDKPAGLMRAHPADEAA